MTGRLVASSMRLLVTFHPRAGRSRTRQLAIAP